MATPIKFASAYFHSNDPELLFNALSAFENENQNYIPISFSHTVAVPYTVGDQMARTGILIYSINSQPAT